MMRKRVGYGLLLAAASVVAVAAGSIDVVSLARDGHVFVSFKMAGGLGEEMRSAIGSGLPTTIAYDVELRRSVPIWFDVTLASVTVSATVRYDNLTRLHQLSRTIDGRGEEPRVTEDPSAVEAWMTTFERLPLFDTNRLEANAEYYVRVRASSRPGVAWFFWPWDRGSGSGSAKFTFLP
jgi:hypothetical protein